jgi:hypothetical protein
VGQIIRCEFIATAAAGRLNRFLREGGRKRVYLAYESRLDNRPMATIPFTQYSLFFTLCSPNTC